MKGAYILLIENRKDSKIRIGTLGKLFFQKGLYAYVGSAMNGLEARINRHLRAEKKTHWHIDYFLKNKNVKIKQVYYKESSRKEECNIAKKISEYGKSVKGFGCSDCKCESHLFRIKNFNPRTWASWKAISVKAGV
ncbi:MAG: GIY-YIG nuclease family protein [Candidatus Aenigmarchaeota archaeon]|nr:GIY-YIG nuclease family protein [Candidatus Aenigmarchaeota archaeon]